MKNFQTAGSKRKCLNPSKMDPHRIMVTCQMIMGNISDEVYLQKLFPHAFCHIDVLNFISHCGKGWEKAEKDACIHVNMKVSKSIMDMA